MSFARRQLDKRKARSTPVEVTDGWWKLAEGYRENPLEDLARSDRHTIPGLVRSSKCADNRSKHRFSIYCSLKNRCKVYAGKAHNGT